MKIPFRKNNKKRGFTLVETLISLMIFSIIILIIGMTLSNVRKDNYDDLTTQFYSYLDVVEDQDYRLKSANSSRLKLMKNHKIYYINLNPRKHQLIMSTNDGGYMMLMKQVKGVNWQYKDGIVYHQVTMVNGDQFNGKSKINKS